VTTPRIEQSDVSEYVQMALSSLGDMRTTEQQAVIWTEAGYDRVGDLEDLANVAVSAMDAVLSELRRIARETGDQT
jgi:hypothetical protein